METETVRLPGTTFDKSKNKWKAQIRLGGKLLGLGYFDTQQEAADVVVARRAVGGGPERMVVVEQPEFTATELVEIKHNQQKPQVFQSNALIESWLTHQSKLGLYEFRLFMRMLQCLHQRDSKLAPIMVPVSSFMPSLDGDYLKTLKAACKSIMSRQLSLPVSDGRRESFSLRTLVISLDYVHSKRAVVGVFHPDLTTHLIQLKKHFAFGDIDVLMQLKSVNSQRFYWLFKEWAGLFKGKAKTIGVDELRLLTCGAGKYGMFSDFRQLVMRPAIEELRAHGFDIKFKEITQARRVTEVVFRVKMAQADQPAERELDQVADKVAVVIADKNAGEYDQSYFDFLLKKGHKFAQYYRHFTSTDERGLNFPHATAKAILEFDVTPAVLMEKIREVLMAMAANKNSSATPLERFRTMFPRLRDKI